MNDEQRYEQGIKVRTEVLGEKHVNRSIENLNDFNADFQNFKIVWELNFSNRFFFMKVKM